MLAPTKVSPLAGLTAQHGEILGWFHGLDTSQKVSTALEGEPTGGLFMAKIAIFAEPGAELGAQGETPRWTWKADRP